MSALAVSIATAELNRRVRARLAGRAVGAAAVVWQQDGDRLLLLLDRVELRTVDGWLVCNVGVQSDETGPQTLQFVFYLGVRGEGDGPRAGATINAPEPQAARIADNWGSEIQRVIWDAVLDAIEAAVAHAAAQRPGQRLALGGFHCDATRIHIDVQASR